MTSAPATRERIVDASGELFRRQGYANTGIKQIAAAAEAQFGSLYHFFPGGKDQLGEEVIRIAGAGYLQLFVDIAGDAPDAPTAFERFFTGAGETLRETDYADACPIATVALEVASTNEPLRIATADVFRSWLDAVAAYLAAAGIDERRSGALAYATLSLLEGAFVLSRALRSTEPLQAAGETAVAAVEAALE
jgi:AcrR family transcriptional regulator